MKEIAAAYPTRPADFGKTATRSTNTLRNLPYFELARESHRRECGDDATMPTNGNEMMLERFDRVDAKLDGVEVRLDGVEARLDRVEVGLGRVEVQLEDIRETLTRFTDTFGGQLDALTREIAESRKEFLAKFLDHERVLTNHKQRMIVLEGRQRGGRRTS
jgi:hypothetical protein